MGSVRTFREAFVIHMLPDGLRDISEAGVFVSDVIHLSTVRVIRFKLKARDIDQVRVPINRNALH